MSDYRTLNEDERKRLEVQGCTAEDWEQVTFAEPVNLSRVRNVCFLGKVEVGQLSGTATVGAASQPKGLYASTLGNVTIGNDCHIKDAGHISGYDIGDGATIEDVGVLTTEPGSSFGCGAEVEAINEGGGREVLLYPELSAQIAHIMALHRYRPAMIEKLEAMIKQRAEEAKADRGTIGAGAEIRSVGKIQNVNIGVAATIEGAAELENGTILSEETGPVEIGSNVILRDFIVAEATSIGEGAVLENCYVGQGCEVGQGFSAENCLFFANCEAFRGEGCAIFAGPYTVTHHKSTLLIGGMFSFYNAGSGTNQSNHMYKLGPVHQGILSRGCKTGSFSYLLWPCQMGPFSVVIGKQMSNFDLADLPFSYIQDEGGRSRVTPAYNLYTVGTMRDEIKWRQRDRREGKVSVKRDLIHFDTFSPYTVGRMLAAEATLTKLADEAKPTAKDVTYNGAVLKRVVLKSTAKWYRTAIDAYLAEKVVARAEDALDQGLAAVRKRLAPESDGAGDGEWIDLSGLLVARERLCKLEDDLEAGTVSDMKALAARLTECYDTYERDEWNWVAATWERLQGAKPSDLDAAGLCEVAEAFLDNRTRFLKRVLKDAGAEFAPNVSIGFGADGDEEARAADFEAVRGSLDDNDFVKLIKKLQAKLEKRVAAFKAKAEALS